jgi:hypothetical protein
VRGLGNEKLGTYQQDLSMKREGLPCQLDREPTIKCDAEWTMVIGYCTIKLNSISVKIHGGCSALLISHAMEGHVNKLMKIGGIQ